ncbi:MAG TPA: DUF1835 domain-containing protein [Burkholderiales bacterium]|nr:DUF1835 domain-containing protein [Burkholderiales bacterium]
MLHITNGDIAVARMRDGNLPGEYLPWRDVLHEGPVPATVSLKELSAIRARYLAECGYGDEASIAAQFTSRDALLSRHAEYKEVVLWFEHDLYDQLHLLQVLDWLGQQPQRASISLIVVGSYPGIDRFLGLGQLTPAQLVGLLDTRIPATRDHFEAACGAWTAFRQSTPVALAGLLASEVPPLPYLRDALLRLLEELPSAGNGLSLTERRALAIVAQGIERPGEIFSELRALEQRPFLGDWPFWRTLAGLTRGSEPLLTMKGGKPFHHPPPELEPRAFDCQRLTLTRAGREVLENRGDAVKLQSIDRWLGGTHLRANAVWRWDGEIQRLIAPS